MFYMDLMCILLTFDNIEGFFNIQNFSLGKPSSRESKSPQLKIWAFQDEGGSPDFAKLSSSPVKFSPI